MSDFKKGDTVQLKSGGPVMTIVDLGDYRPTGPTNGALCNWFVGTKINEKIFEVDAIICVEAGIGIRPVRTKPQFF